MSSCSPPASPGAKAGCLRNSFSFMTSSASLSASRGSDPRRSVRMPHRRCRSHRSATKLPSGGTSATVLNETQFGFVAEIRAALVVVLAACLLLDRFVLPRWLALLAALGLVGAIAWTGHAGSTLGELGDLHLAADVLHLAAASAWVGGLIGLLVMFAVGRRHPSPEWAPLQLDAIRRFSTIGLASVGALIGSGIVNAWMLVGSFRALLVTDYGQLLLLKLAVFAAMVAFATINRFSPTPQLALAVKGEGDGRALSALTGNTWIEFALALPIFAIVGVLGTLHPAIHMVH
jgi:putative copper resistance protein D